MSAPACLTDLLANPRNPLKRYLVVVSTGAGAGLHSLAAYQYLSDQQGTDIIKARLYTRVVTISCVNAIYQRVTICVCDSFIRSLVRSFVSWLRGAQADNSWGGRLAKYDVDRANYNSHFVLEPTVVQVWSARAMIGSCSRICR
jgi:hypothetical protein